ncbi:MAG: sensor histidine kinase [Jatrophihabitantaceae bacterium]
MSELSAAGDGRGIRRWSILPQSLTTRLTTGVVLLVVLVVLATGFGTYYALQAFLFQRLDQQLLQTTDSNTAVANLFGSTPGSEPGGVHVPQHVWAVAIDSTGKVLAYPSSSDVEEMSLDAADRRALGTRASSAPLTVHTSDGVELRVTVQPVPVVFPQGIEVRGIAVIGLSTDELRRTLEHLLRLELLIGASAVTVALVATAYGVRFSLRRLRRVTRTAQEVAAELSPEGAGLDRRVPVAESGTEVGRLAESMNTLLSAVETQFAARLESERRMRQFLADASHELRTPLTSIRGYAELARMQRTVGGGEQTTADNIERIESEGTRMSRLVDDLLTLARSDQGSLPERETVDVAELLDDAISSSRAAFPQREIDVCAPNGLTVVGDHDQLLRVVRNLVTNAATHTRPDSTITVRAFAESPGVTMQICDEGPGLPPEEAAHVFERFWRADRARSRARGGSGLGLAIVASIVQMHGGTVQFASTVERGSTVTVWLPVGTA